MNGGKLYRKYHSGCKPKRKYEYREEAQDAADLLAQSGKDIEKYGTNNIQPYFCPICRYWHIGHKAKRNNQSD